MQALAGVINGVAATTSHRDRDELDLAVVRLLLQVLEPLSITLLRLIEDGQVKRIEPRVCMQRPGEDAGSGSPLVTKSLPLGDFPAWEECTLRREVVRCDVRDGSPHSTVFPIHGEHAVTGVLVLDSADPLPQRQVDLVVGVLSIVRNHLALLDYSELDTLTGLLNRKTFERQFEKVCQRVIDPQPIPIAQAVTGSELSWLALVDIDHFKSINDSYGHLFGDEILLLVSQLMRRSFRGADHLYRFGGEEFVVMLARASEPGAHVAFERLRAAVEEYPFPQVGRVTISVGYTRINPQEVPALCVERADAALYYAKNHGRNNVRGCEALVAAGKISAHFRIGDIELF
jgi:diguanylate cyclase (GGDEF)-like protein